MLAHRNIVANLQQAHAWLKNVLEEGRETVITALPLYHIFALTANCLTFFKIGATNILITNPRDIPGFVKELGKHRFSAITGVNTLYNALLNNPDFAKLDFSNLRVSLSGGMALHKSVAERWKQVTGKTLVEAYGLTETSSGGDHQSARPRRIQRIDRASRFHRPRSRSATRQGNDARARAGRRAVRARPAGDEGLLAACGRDRQGHDCPMASCAPATWRPSTRTVSFASSIASRT